MKSKIQKRMVQMARKMAVYGEREHRGKFVLDDYTFSRNHAKGVTIRRWKRNLKRAGRRQWKKELEGIA